MEHSPATPTQKKFQAVFTKAEQAASEQLDAQLSSYDEETHPILAANAAASMIARLFSVSFPDAFLIYLLPALERALHAPLEERPFIVRLREVVTHLAAFEQLCAAGYRDKALWRHIVDAVSVTKIAYGSPDTGGLLDRAIDRNL